MRADLARRLGSSRSRRRQAGPFRAFCADDAQERLGLLRLDRLGAGFRAWLGEGAASDSDQLEMQEVPLAMFALSYLTATLPCAEAATSRAGDDAALDSALQRALPR